MAGDDAYCEVRNEFYDDTSGVLLIFDVTSMRSFNSLMKWIREMNSEVIHGNVEICVCGNKVDQSPRTVSYYEASQWCASRHLRYFETSALTGHGVTDAINTLLESIVEPDGTYAKKQSTPHDGTSHYKPGEAMHTEPQPPPTSKVAYETESSHQPFKPAHSPRRGGGGGSKSGRAHTPGYSQSQLTAVGRILHARNHNERLGVSQFATKDEVNRAYRKLAFTVHPDKNFAPRSEEAFKLLVDARTALIQTDLRLPTFKFHPNV